MRNHHPKGVRPAPVPSSLASLDVGRQALLLDLLTELAQCQEPEAVWAVLATRLKWLLDFERCDVAVVNPDHQTYHLRTVFDARPAVPHVDEAQVPLAAGLVGVLLLRGTASVMLRCCLRGADILVCPTLFAAVSQSSTSEFRIMWGVAPAASFG